MKRGTFDDSQVSTIEAAETAKNKNTADSIFGQKSGPALAGPAGPATTALFIHVLSYNGSVAFCRSLLIL